MLQYEEEVSSFHFWGENIDLQADIHNVSLKIKAANELLELLVMPRSYQQKQGKYESGENRFGVLSVALLST